MATAKKGDHKRQARAIGPATVTVRDGEIVVVVPDVLGKNASHKQSKNGGRRISEQTEEYRKSVLNGAGALEMSVLTKWFDVSTTGHFAGSGAWRLEVIGVWPTQREKLGGKPVEFGMPVGDADAAIPQALDALQHAGILDDDARVVEVRAWNLYRKGVRATIMRLVRIVDSKGRPDPSLQYRDEACAHLLPLVPQSPEQSAKPRRARKAKSTC